MDNNTNQAPDTVTTAVGLADGEVVITAGDAKNEKVVYDYDKDGQFIGWHKELV